MALEFYEIVNGTLSLCLVIIYIIVGFFIALKYRKRKDRVYILFGIGYMTIIQSWYPSSISFLLAIFTGKGLPPIQYFIIGTVAIPLCGICLLTAVTDMFLKEKQKLILLIYLFLFIIFEITFFYFIFTDPSQIGELKGPIDVEYKSFVTYFLAFILISILVFGILFGIESIRTEDPEMTLRGKILIIGFCLFVVCAFIDSSIPLNVMMLTLVRIGLILTAIIFYCAFVLPEWIKKLFLKKQT